MKNTVFVVFMTFLVVISAHAQQAQTDSPTKTQAITPIAGIDDAALAGSARASKLISSKIYKGDTSIGQIQDALLDIDHATVTAVILSFGRKAGCRAGQPDQGRPRGKVYNRSDKGAACQRAGLRLRQTQVASMAQR